MEQHSVIVAYIIIRRAITLIIIYIGIVEKVQETSLTTDMRNRAITVLHEQ